MKENFEEIFDCEIKNNIKDSFDDIVLSDEVIKKIKIEANKEILLKENTIKEKINKFLNYEIEIEIGKIAIVAAILVLIPIGFTIKENNKIMENKIEPINIKLTENK